MEMTVLWDAALLVQLRRTVYRTRKLDNDVHGHFYYLLYTWTKNNIMENENI